MPTSLNAKHNKNGDKVKYYYIHTKYSKTDGLFLSK